MRPQTQTTILLLKITIIFLSYCLLTFLILSNYSADSLNFILLNIICVCCIIVITVQHIKNEQLLTFLVFMREHYDDINRVQEELQKLNARFEKNDLEEFSDEGVIDDEDFKDV